MSLRDECEAIRDADTLHMLPKEALIASDKDLAETVLALLDQIAQARAEWESHPLSDDAVEPCAACRIARVFGWDGSDE